MRLCADPMGGLVTWISRSMGARPVEAVASMPAVETDDGVKGAELVLVNKAEAVNQFYKATSNARGTYRGSARGGSSTGHGAGSTAGSRASLGSGASIGGKRAIA